MQTTVASVLAEAQAFLREYVAAKRHATGMDIKDALDTALRKCRSDAPSKGGTVKHVVDFCLELLFEIRDHDSSPGNMLGSSDLKTIDALGEITVYIIFTPILRENDFPLPTNSALAELSTLQPLPVADACALTLKLASLLQTQGRTFAVFVRHDILCVILAGSIGLDHLVAPDNKKYMATVSKSILESAPQQRIMSCLQALLVQGKPGWAVKRYKSELTAVLTRPGGLQAVVTFILQPDSTGNVPMERFSHLTALIAAVPSSTSTEDYMHILSPQISTLMRETTPLKDRQRKAAAVILHKLFATHETALVIVKDFWAALIPTSIDYHEARVSEALTCLENASSFQNLRLPLLSAYVPTMISHAYMAQEAGETSVRDILQRLLYRLLEEDRSTDLVCGLDSILPLADTGNLEQSRPLEYFLNLLDYLKMDGVPIDCLLEALVVKYPQVYDPSIRLQLLRLMLEVPKRHPSAFTADKRVRKWIDNIDTHFKTMLTQIGTSQVDELLLVLASLLQLLADKSDIANVEAFEAHKRLISTSRSLLSKPIDGDFRQTLSEILSKLELSVLRYSSQVAVPVSGSADSSSTTEEQSKMFASALNDLKDDMVPNRAHGLYLIGELAKSGAPINLMQLERLTPIMLQLLAEEEAFVHHNAVKAITKLFAAYGEQYKPMLDSALENKVTTEVVKDRIRAAIAAAEPNAHA